MREALIPGEGSRPRPAAAGLLSKPRTGCDLGQKYTFGFWHVLAARGDARPPFLHATLQGNVN
jgi:hypothetical protein